MADGPRHILLCSCEDTMAPDGETVRRACRGSAVTTARQLCRAELDKFRKAAAAGGPLTVACTQEAPLFSEATDGADIAFVNIRETAGWSADAARAGPKMAALLAAAAEPAPVTDFVSLTSEGVILIYGRDERAIEAAALLKDHLDVTVLIRPPAEVTPPRVTDFPVVKGAIRSAKGHLGAFELVVDDYAPPAPSSRGALAFGASKDGAVSRCDLILDLSGGAPLFTAADLRDGYLRADPTDPAALLKAMLTARDLVGTFDKPRYVAFTEEICAHSRSRIVGCNRCLDLCPTGAIAPAGDHVAIDAMICAGCGQCAAVCPTGAASYALPPADALMRKLRTLLTTYREAGGAQPVVLIHDEPHGMPLIDALARFGDGLPANVLPLAVNEVTQVGLEAIAAAFAYGASALRLLLRAKPRHDVAGLDKDAGAGGADPARTRVRRGPRGRDRDRRSGRARRGVARHQRARRRAAAGELRPGRRQARSAAAGLARAAPRGAVAGRRGGAARRRAVRHGRGERRGLHALPRLRVRLPDRRARRRSGEADAAVLRGRLRAVRAVQGDLPGEGDHAPAAARLPRRHRIGARSSSRRSRSPASAAASRSASRARSSASPPSSKASTGCSRATAKRLDVLKMCEDCRVIAVTEERFRSLRRAGAGKPAHDRRLPARARGAGAKGRDVRELLRRLLQEFHQRCTVSVAELLLRHLGAGRVGHRADLEQFRHRLRRPHDVACFRSASE